MNIKQVLAQLISQRNRLDTAIAALQQLSDEGSSGTQAAIRSFDGRRRRRHMSPEAKRRISEMMKKRWAERKRAMAKTA